LDDALIHITPSSAADKRGATFCDSKNRESFDCQLDEFVRLFYCFV